MKSLSLILILSATLQVSAQTRAGSAEYADNREYLEAKLHKFQSMRTTGIVLGCLGAAALVGGIALASNGEWETEQTATGSQTNAQDGAAVGGLLLIMAGVPTMVTGIVLGTIGGNKVRQYRDRLNGYSLDLRPGHAGVRYTYSW